MARRGHALEGGELLIDGCGQSLESSRRIRRLGLRLGEEGGRAGEDKQDRGRAGEDEQDRPPAPHGAMIPRGGQEDRTSTPVSASLEVKLSAGTPALVQDGA